MHEQYRHNPRQSHQPHIFALQEVDSRRRTSSTSEAFDFLSEELGGNTHATRLIRAVDGDYGHAVISCWPIEAARFHDISYKRREHRVAIETVVNTPHGPLQIVAAHLGLSLRERRQQAEKLVEIVRKGNECSVLMCDLNDWDCWRCGAADTGQTIPGAQPHEDVPCVPTHSPAGPPILPAQVDTAPMLDRSYSPACFRPSSGCC
ncbi:endonuclease/exonuclease/phosphatase family protein [Sulfitobacter indolifex]|uniref:endonuclease/exonuclease/phosphatase family protein n=1 Tax=Sulfitobacter indolifex TaxID=225422 RepID=UPI00389B185A